MREHGQGLKVHDMLRELGMLQGQSASPYAVNGFVALIG
jgi:hypothetical protein